MKSMTGFGRGTASHLGMEITVEVSTVNRRTLECSFGLPKDWSALERTLTETVRGVLSRGKVHVAVIAARGGSGRGLTVDETAVGASLQKLKALAVSQGLPWAPDADVLFRLVSLHQAEASPGVEPALEEAVQGALKTALTEVDAMRAREGAALAADLAARGETLARLRAEIVTEAPQVPARYREQLFARLRQSGLELDLSDERVLKEVAIFADRADIVEELTRLDSHLQQLQQILRAEDSVGRKLEFLLQEVHREFNTIGAKANALAITRCVLEAKNEIERIREQIQNIE